jgi:hypothetical protein
MSVAVKRMSSIHTHRGVPPGGDRFLKAVSPSMGAVPDNPISSRSASGLSRPSGRYRRSGAT